MLTLVETYYTGSNITLFVVKQVARSGSGANDGPLRYREKAASSEFLRISELSFHGKTWFRPRHLPAWHTQAQYSFNTRRRNHYEN